MPKGTIVTLSTDGVAAGEMPDVNAARRNIWPSLKQGCCSLLLLSFGRECLLINILAFLLSRVALTGELAPFGLAFLVSVARIDRKCAGGAGIWSILGLVSVGRYDEIWLYVFSALIYFFLTDKISAVDNKPAAMPVIVFLSVAIGAAPVALWMGATLYSLLLVFFEAVTCVVLVYIFSGGVKLLMVSPQVNQAVNEILLCLVILLSLAVAGIGDTVVAGYSLRSIAGSFTVMTLALTGGTVGTVVGVTVGLAVGLSDANATAVISFYAICGLLAAVFRSLGRFGVATGFVIGCIITGLHFGQAGELTQIICETAIGAAAFIMLPGRWIRRWSERLNLNQAKENHFLNVIHDAQQKLASVAGIFSRMAADSGMNPIGGGKEQKLEDLLAAVGVKVCEECRRRSSCWDDNYYKTLRGVTDALVKAESAKLTPSSLPQQLGDNCCRKREMAEVINNVAKNDRCFAFQPNNKRQAVAEQYKAISGIFDTLAAGLKIEADYDEEAAADLKNKAAYIDCPVHSVRVNPGEGSVEIIKSPCAGSRECENTILPLTEKVLRKKLTLHSQCGEGRRGGECRLKLKPADVYRVNIGLASSGKEQGICGDTCAVIKLPQAKTALVISDGMGCGKKAAGESSATVEYLSQLLQAGFEVKAAVKTVNDMLLLRGPEESFATLDIAIIDNCSGDVCFYKVGAAPSYIKRVREVETVKSAAPPVGILEQVDIEPEKRRMVPGDIIVMVSDGIIDIHSRNMAREPWLANFLRRMPEDEPQVMADKILRQTLELTEIAMRDDMTVLVARLDDAAERLFSFTE